MLSPKGEDQGEGKTRFLEQRRLRLAKKPPLGLRTSNTHSTENSEVCASEVDRDTGESPVRRIGLFTTDIELDSVAARQGWKPREMNRRAVTKVNHI